jgi:O-antigen ligase
MKGLIKYWYSWFKNQPWVLRWFLWLILLMPVIGMFHDKGSGFSILQLVGLLVFSLSLITIISRRVKLLGYEMFLLFFGGLLVFNNVIFFLLDISIANFGFVLRNLLPLNLYFYFRRVVKSRKEFEGILLTFLVSSILPYSILLYEFVFAPIKEVYTQESRGGYVRLSGFYADIFSYMAYIIGDFIIISYFLIRRKLNFKILQFVTFIGLTLIGVLSISHQASWVVWIVILLLLWWFSKGSKVSSKITVVLIVGSIVGGGLFVEQYITPLFAKEINAYQGNIDQDRALNGRIIRWQRFFAYWEKMSIQYQLFGVGTSGSYHTKTMMSGGMHSDYVRFTFSTGILGVLLYILFYIGLLFRSKGLQKPEKFFLISAIAVMLLYGISANPFGSSGALIYLTMAIFALSAIGKNRIYGGS